MKQSPTTDAYVSTEVKFGIGLECAVIFQPHHNSHALILAGVPLGVQLADVKDVGHQKWMHIACIG